MYAEAVCVEVGCTYHREDEAWFVSIASIQQEKRACAEGEWPKAASQPEMAEE